MYLSIFSLVISIIAIILSVYTVGKVVSFTSTAKSVSKNEQLPKILLDGKTPISGKVIWHSPRCYFTHGSVDTGITVDGVPYIIYFKSAHFGVRMTEFLRPGTCVHVGLVPDRHTARVTQLFDWTPAP